MMQKSHRTETDHTHKCDQVISPGDPSIGGCGYSVFCLSYELALLVRTPENTETSISHFPELHIFDPASAPRWGVAFVKVLSEIVGGAWRIRSP